MISKIYPIEHKYVVGFLGKEMRKERVAIKKIDENTKYLCWMNGAHVVGAVGWQVMKNNHIRLKSGFVRLLFRGKNIYSQLWDARLSLILEKHNPLVLSAFCTPKSLPLFLKRGFIAEKPPKKGITYVKLYIKPKKNAELQRMESGVPEEKLTLH